MLCPRIANDDTAAPRIVEEAVLRLDVPFQSHMFYSLDPKPFKQCPQ